MEIIVRKWEHYNRSMGKYIGSKKQYTEEMKRGGFVPYDEGCNLADRAAEKLHKPYILSPKAESLIKSARLMTDRKGKLNVGNRLIEGMKEVGVRLELPDWCPKHYKEGGYASDKQR